MKKLCECASKRCRTPVGVDHDMYARYTAHGRRFVTAMHHDARTERVVKTLSGGRTFLVEGLGRKAARKPDAMVTVICPACDTSRTVKERQHRRIVSGQHSGLCLGCRYPAADVRALRTDSNASVYHAWWRKRFTQAQIDQLWSEVSLFLDPPATEQREAA